MVRFVFLVSVALVNSSLGTELPLGGVDGKGQVLHIVVENYCS